MAVAMGVMLAACGAKQPNPTEAGSGASDGKIKSDLVGNYEIVYQDGSSISKEDVELIKSSGENITLEVSGDGSAEMVSIGVPTKLTFDKAKMTMTDETGATIKVSVDKDVLVLDENGALLFFAPVDESAASKPATPADMPAQLDSGSDTVKRQVLGVDSDLSFYYGTGVNDILLTNGGRLTLMTYGDLAGNEGAEVTLAQDATFVDIFDYGNNGYRAIVFLKDDGTVGAVDPAKLIDEKKVEIISPVGDLKHITAVRGGTSEDGTPVIIVTDWDGVETDITPYL